MVLGRGLRRVVRAMRIGVGVIIALMLLGCSVGPGIAQASRARSAAIVAPGLRRPVGKPVAVATSLENTCVLYSTSSVACGGEDEDGEVGRGTKNDSSSDPALVHGLTDATQVGVGQGSACALRRSGGVVCWGSGGDLGDGTDDDSSLPVPVIGLEDATQLPSAFWYAPPTDPQDASMPREAP
jgi:hypothetical protein